jgi:hypothetical protein
MRYSPPLEGCLLGGIVPPRQAAPATPPLEGNLFVKAYHFKRQQVARYSPPLEGCPLGRGGFDS